LIHHPDKPLKCLLIQPEFADFSFWNYKESCNLIGAKTPSPPLGLITVAAILPQHWSYRLMDLNTKSFNQKDWEWADLVCVGGMLPQQKNILKVIELANRDGKFIAVGGPDPSSQPEIYQKADVVVVGEGESAIPIWLESWRSGKPSGLFKEKEKPDVAESPCPRFDLLNFADYAQIGVQYSRGCPFNCEFCDIIELYGRKPRTKTPEQILRELTLIKNLGYSGSVDIVDDNFIGNKRNVKRNLLPALIEWNKNNNYPFFYSTEASMNLGDDEGLLAQMRDAEFRIVFMGIETPEHDLLLMTQKSQNTVRPIEERVHKIYEYGIVVTAGFILGFDGEKKLMDQSMIHLIEKLKINMAMVGLLVALPNTQLTRRLIREGRLLNFRGQRVQSEADLRGSANMAESNVAIVDQTVAGLNFVTTRNRFEIIEEYINVIRHIYSPKSYFGRLLELTKILKTRTKHKPNLFELRRNLRGFYGAFRLTRSHPELKWRFWQVFLRAVPYGPAVVEQIMRLVGIYLHFQKQVDYVTTTLQNQIKQQKASMPADFHELKKPVAKQAMPTTLVPTDKEVEAPGTAQANSKKMAS
jgi:radical SAM superfamily enzyme YgiQ (UPF0313 family)